MAIYISNKKYFLQKLPQARDLSPFIRVRCFDLETAGSDGCPGSGDGSLLFPGHQAQDEGLLIAH